MQEKEPALRQARSALKVILIIEGRPAASTDEPPSTDEKETPMVDNELGGHPMISSNESQSKPGKAIIETVKNAIKDALTQHPELTQAENRSQLVEVIARYATVAPVLDRGVVTRDDLRNLIAEQLGEQQGQQGPQSDKQGKADEAS